MLEDLFRPDVLVVFCGAAVGTRSAALGQYYAGRGNRFWEILAATKLTPRLLAPSEWRLLPTFGIGLTDIAKERAGNDVAIAFRSADRELLRDKVGRYQLQYFCFNGKRAAQEFFGTKALAYGQQTERIGPTALFVLPSTSGAARASWDERFWHELAGLIRQVEHGPTSNSRFSADPLLKQAIPATRISIWRSMFMAIRRIAQDSQVGVGSLS